jgi:hypothetical protein
MTSLSLDLDMLVGQLDEWMVDGRRRKLGYQQETKRQTEMVVRTRVYPEVS